MSSRTIAVVKVQQSSNTFTARFLGRSRYGFLGSLLGLGCLWRKIEIVGRRFDPVDLDCGYIIYGWSYFWGHEGVVDLINRYHGPINTIMGIASGKLCIARDRVTYVEIGMGWSSIPGDFGSRPPLRQRMTRVNIDDIKETWR
jgi:hypothetical protein